MGRQAAFASCRPCDCGLRAARGLTNFGHVVEQCRLPCITKSSNNHSNDPGPQSKLTPSPGDLSPQVISAHRNRQSSVEAVVVMYLNFARRDCPYAFRGPLSGFPSRRGSVLILLFSSITFKAESVPLYVGCSVENRRVSESGSRLFLFCGLHVCLLHQGSSDAELSSSGLVSCSTKQVSVLT